MPMGNAIRLTNFQNAIQTNKVDNKNNINNRPHNKCAYYLCSNLSSLNVKSSNQYIYIHTILCESCIIRISNALNTCKYDELIDVFINNFFIFNKQNAYGCVAILKELRRSVKLINRQDISMLEHKNVKRIISLGNTTTDVDIYLNESNGMLYIK